MLKKRITSVALVLLGMLLALAFCTSTERKAEAVIEKFHIGRKVINAHVSGSSVTWDAGTRYVWVRMCGAGGGGGAGKGTASNIGVGGGGGGGGYFEKLIDCTGEAGGVCPNATVTDGSGGAGGAAATPAAGTDGSDTTFTMGSTICTSGVCTAKGGKGGAASSAVGAGGSTLGGTTQGTTSTGDISHNSTRGFAGIATTIALGVSGAGADSEFGAGGDSKNAAGAGNNAIGFCSGGGGGMSISTTGGSGGNGADGVFIADEYH